MSESAQSAKEAKLDGIREGAVVRTVLGDIPATELGVTLPHEHVLVDGSHWFVEPEGASEKWLAHQPVSLDILWWLRYHPFYQNLDDIVLSDEALAEDELLRFKREGGTAIVDLTNVGIGRDPDALVRVSRSTGLHIIMGAGYYTEASQRGKAPAGSVKEVAEAIARDATEGVGRFHARAGVIGEVGTTWPITEVETRSLQAAAGAQRLTGLGVNVHPGQSAEAPMAIVRILDSAGADLSRVAISHLDRALRDISALKELAGSGVFIEYDLFGDEGYYPMGFRVIDLPNDAQRINEIRELMAAGYERQILISHDICTKRQLCKYGGFGYGHILRNTVPVMAAKGMTQDEIDQLMIYNPRLFLAIS
jgi:phosphotriesterase-related protein